MKEEVTSAPGIPLEVGLPSPHVKQPLLVPRQAPLPRPHGRPHDFLSEWPGELRISAGARAPEGSQRVERVKM